MLIKKSKAYLCANFIIMNIFPRFFCLLSVITVLFLSSCAQKKDIVYYQNIDQFATGTASASFEPKLQPDDLLMIVVSAENPEVAAPFNLYAVTIQSNLETAGNQPRLQTYLVDSKGEISFPVIGNIKLGGLTRSEAMVKLKELLGVYIKNPTVNMRILNYKITIQGEVTRPGTYPIQSERITLLEAVSMAGDLTVYGKRNNILVLREMDGKVTSTRVDLTNSNFINSPFYYLKQNDVVYVEPNKTKVNSSVIGPNITVAISAISLLITIIALTTR